LAGKKGAGFRRTLAEAMRTRIATHAARDNPPGLGNARRQQQPGGRS
jgi:hypothetical protein